MHPLNMTDEEVKALEEKSRSLTSLIKDIRIAGGNPGNPLTDIVEEIFSRKKCSLYDSPFFYQILFIAADMGAENALEELNKIEEILRNSNNV